MKALREQLPSGRFLTGTAELFCYRYDASIDRYPPAAVFLPHTREELVEGLKAIWNAARPLTCRGAGTGLSGGSVPSPGAVVLATSKLRRIHKLSVENRLAVVEPGLVNLAFNKLLAPHKLCFAPDPSSQKTCTLGGNVAENAGGPHCLKYGVTRPHILGLEILLPATSEVLTLGGETLDPPGYDLLALLIGSEGTLAPILNITARLLPIAPSSATLLAAFASVREACEAVTRILTAGTIPAALELIDRMTIEAVEESISAGYPADAEAVLLIDLDGLESSVDSQILKVRQLIESSALELREAQDANERAKLWRGRKEAIGALGRKAPNYYIQDGVIPRSALPGVLPRINELCANYGLKVANVFHAGDGNLHPVILFDSRIEGEVERVVAAGTEILELCVNAGGSLSGEHGVGIEKRHAIGLLFSAEDCALFERIQRIFDPDSLMNPGKVLPTTRGCREGGREPRKLWLGPPAPKARAFIKRELRAHEVLLSEEIKAFNSNRQRWCIVGSGEWEPGIDNDRSRLAISSDSARVEVSAADLYLIASASTKIVELEAAAKAAGLRLPLLNAFHGAGTLGGLISVRPGGGHRRPAHGSARERLISARFLSGTGDIHQIGNRVAKDVAGYDLGRVLLGARGSLGLITEIGLQLIPRQSGASLVFFGSDVELERAAECLVLSGEPWAALSLFNPGAAEILWPQSEGRWALAFGIEDETESCEFALAQAQRELRKLGLHPASKSTGEEHEALWNEADSLADRLKLSHPIWSRYNGNGREALTWLRRNAVGSCIASARRLCGVVDVFERQPYIGHKADRLCGWFRQLRPWNPLWEREALSSGQRALMRGLKTCFDPLGLLPAGLTGGEGDNT